MAKPMGEFAAIMEQEKQCAPDSSMIARVEYEYASSTMYVIFNSGRVYGYEAVPATVFDALCKAPSTGTFFNKNVRNAYRFTRLS